ncbi:MAG: KpsF/GutQ family sugar-phosphate isomerase [bacterium]
MSFSDEQLQQIARTVLQTESAALISQRELINEQFCKACRLILDCRGRVIISGMGKSGHIAQKIAASLTSTGIATHFMHPAEGVHGDLGVVHRHDLLLAISNSGETAEITSLLGPVSTLGVPVISITRNPESTLARHSDAVLLLADAPEADPHNLVPTTSTTLTLALGDALTITLMQMRGFTPEEFAVFHPSGMLGKRLTLKVADLLRGDETNPVLGLDSSFSSALEVITSYALGGTSITDESGKLAGILTDGDVRRVFSRAGHGSGTVADVLATPVSELMTREPSSIRSDDLAYDALKKMENHQPRPIMVLPVLDSLDRPVGMLNIHTLVQAGFKAGSQQ